MPAALYVLFRSVPTLAGPTVEHNGHVLRVVAVNKPVPEVEMQRCLPVAHLRPEHKEELRTHRAHVAMVHETDTPDGDGLVAMYQAARALGGPGELVGVINPITCMCLTAKILDATLEPDFIAAARKNPASTLGLWLGLVKLFKEDGSTWLLTTGGPMCHLPNLAMLAERREDVDRTHDMLATALEYLYESKRTFMVGDTVDLAGKPLQIAAPTEFVDYIGAETLVLAPRT
jgi:hypothetical protein